MRQHSRSRDCAATLGAFGLQIVTASSLDKLLFTPSKSVPLVIKEAAFPRKRHVRCVPALADIFVRTDGACRIRAGSSPDQRIVGDRWGDQLWSAGGLADLPLLTNWEPDFVTMMPVTALAILLITLGLLPQFSAAPRWRIAIGVIVTLLGAGSLIQELGDLNLGLAWLARPAPFQARAPPISLCHLLPRWSCCWPGLLPPCCHFRGWQMPCAFWERVLALSEQRHFWVTFSASVPFIHIPPSTPLRSRQPLRRLRSAPPR